MSPELVSAAIGLFGVLIGAAISTGVQVWLVQRQEKAEKEREAATDQLELTIAARLVRHELDVLHAFAVAYKESGVWSIEKLSIPAWDLYKPILARELAFQDWKELASAQFFATSLDIIRGYASPSAQEIDSNLDIVIK